MVWYYCRGGGFNGCGMMVVGGKGDGGQGGGCGMMKLIWCGGVVDGLV